MPARRRRAEAPNKLYYGDNLDVLREHIADDSVDLIYLDPPFNSNRSYNVLFRQKSGMESQAQIEAFDDTWTWSQESRREYERLVAGGAPPQVADAVEAMHRVLGENDVLAYLVMMTPRLLELHRVLKSSGSLYLHCDPTASHYLKLMLDAIFGPTNFRNEIVWRRTGSHGPRRSFGPIHDTLLFYTKSNAYYFSVVRRPYTRQHVDSRYRPDDTGRLVFISGGNVLTGAGSTGGESGQEWQGFDPSARNRHWAVPGFLTEQMGPEFSELGVLAKLDALYEAGLIVITPGAAWPVPLRYLNPGDGQPLQDMWAYQPGTEETVHGTDRGIDHDVQWLGPTDPERLGFPTQKPVGLLERIIKSSCPEEGIVLDPFCGCGTTVVAAQKLGRRWIGIDVTHLAIDLIDNRVRDIFSESVADEYEILGIPRDIEGARALFARSPFEFERWAVAQVDATPNQRQVGDRGSDGVVRFPIDRRSFGRVLVSVKGGATVNPGMVRDLAGTVEHEGAQLGLIITMTNPTRGMEDAIRHSGSYMWPVDGRDYPKLQCITVEQLLAGEKPTLPPAINPYSQANPFEPEDEQLTLGG